ncbi:MAG: C10 family peptidase [Bacteroidales bacterium]|nr:C10 family peptidase [Bacteroidales bacterium]
MKKILIFFLFSIFCSCVAENTEYILLSDLKQNHSKHRTINSAIKEANHAFHDFFPMTKSSCEVDTAFFITNTTDTLLIIVNYKHNSGFAIVSANKEDMPILGIFDKGSFQENYDNNPGFQICYNEILANQELYYQQNLSTKSINENYYNVVSTITSTSTIGPLINVNWGQRAPFNLYCPNVQTPLAGCTPVAIAQAMSYFEYPNALSITYTDTISSPIILRWRDLKAHNHEFCTPLCKTCKTASHLLREIGHRCKANYNASSTGAWPYAEYLSKFRYQCKQSATFNITDIEDFIWEYRLAILCGFNPSGTGHTWVVDGVKNIRYTNTYYLTNPDGTETEVYSENCIDKYLHFNFGWYGSGNGFILCQIEVNCNGNTIYPKTLFSGNYTDIRLQISNLRSNAAREL